MFVKDPGARLDYRLDWTDRLAPGVVLVASSWNASPEGLQLSDMSFEGPVALVWAAAGTAGHRYRLTNRVQFSDGSVDERTMLLRVEER